jgi:hypothetical protein
MVGFFVSSFASSELAIVSAPPGLVRGVEAVERDGADVIDPTWRVSIRQNSGLLARDWKVGCFSGDTGQYNFDHVERDGRSTLVVTILRGSTTVVVNPATGRPRPVTDPKWDSCS